MAGSQDAIGIVYPGLNLLDYAGGEYWPREIVSEQGEDILQFLESRIWLWPLGARAAGYSVLENTDVGSEAAAALAAAAQNLFAAARWMDDVAVGKAMTDSFQAQIAMFPNMTSPEIDQVIREVYAMHPWVLGHKLSGAGGGGYLVLFSEKPIPNTLQLKIRRAGL